MARDNYKFSFMKDVFPYLMEGVGLVSLITNSIRAVDGNFDYNHPIKNIVASTVSLAIYVTGRYLSKNRLEERILKQINKKRK